MPYEKSHTHMCLSKKGKDNHETKPSEKKLAAFIHGFPRCRDLASGFWQSSEPE